MFGILYGQHEVGHNNSEGRGGHEAGGRLLGTEGASGLEARSGVISCIFSSLSFVSVFVHLWKGSSAS